MSHISRTRSGRSQQVFPGWILPYWLVLVFPSLFLTRAMLRADEWIGVTATSAGSSRLSKLDPETGAFANFAPATTTTALSRDGARIAYRDAAGLHVAKADGTEDTVILPGSISTDLIRWSPVGDRLAYKSSAAIRIVSTAGAALGEIADGTHGDFDWSPDGTKIVYHTYTGFNAPVPGSGTGQIRTVVGSMVRIKVKDLTTGGTTLLREWTTTVFQINAHYAYAIREGASPTGLRWSPAGNEAAFTYYRSKEVFKFTGGGPQPLPPNHTREERRILSVIDTTGGSIRELVASHWSAYDPGLPVWSPDGLRIAYMAGTNGIYTISSAAVAGALPAVGAHTDLGFVLAIPSGYPGTGLRMLDWISKEPVRLRLTTSQRMYSQGEVFVAEVTARLMRPYPATLQFEEPLVGVDFPEVLAVRATDLPPPLELTPENPVAVFQVAVTAKDFGKAKLLTRAIATTEDGTLPLSAERLVVVNPLEAEVTITPSRPLLNQTPESKWGARARAINDARRAAGQPALPNLVEIELKVLNEADTPVEAVNLPGAVDVLTLITSTNLESPGVPMEPVRFYAPNGSQIDLTDPDADPTVEPVTLEPGEEITFAWVLKAFDADPAPESDDSAKLEFEALVMGRFDGEEVRILGTKEFEIVERPLLEWGIRPKEGRTAYQSGQVVRIDGYLENISTRDGKPPVDLRVMIYQMAKDNLGGGFMFDPAKSGGGETSKYYEIFKLPAEGDGKILPLSAIMTSFPTVAASGGTVKYGVRLWTVEPDPEAERGEDVNEATAQAIVKEGDGWGTEFEVTFSPNRPAFTYQEECSALKDSAPGFVAWSLPFLCGLEQGLVSLPEGLMGLGKFLIHSGQLTLDAGIGIVVHETNTLRKTWRIIQGNPAALEALNQEIYVQYRTLVELGIMAGEGGSKVPMALGAFAEHSAKAMGDFFNDMENGRVEEVEYAVGYFLGSNPDLILEPLIVARNYQRMSRALLAIEGDIVDNAVRSSIVAENARQASTVNQRVAAAAAAGKSPASGLLPGDILSDAKLLDIYGITIEQRKQLQKIAKDHGIILNFRSRNPISVKLLKERLAWPKPQAMKHKTVNRIDIEFLGYRNESFGKLEMVEPPPGLRRPDGRTLTGPELETALDNEMQQLQGLIGNNEVLRTEVRERMKTRAKEWNNLFMDKVDPSQAGTLQHKITTSFDAELQHLPSQRDRVKQVGAKESRTVTYEPIPGRNPRAWEMKMTGPNNEPARWITGDVDFLSILDESGGLIRDVQKRREIYVQLEALLDMQHGESFTFYLQKVRQENLDLCTFGKPDAEAMVSISGVGDGTPRAAYYVDNLSIIDNPGCPNAKWLPRREKTPLPLRDIILRRGQPMEIRRADPSGEYMLLDGAHINTKPPLDLQNRFLPLTLDETLEQFLLSRNFIVPALLLRLFYPDGTPVTYTEGPDASVLQGFEEGNQVILKELNANGEWVRVTPQAALSRGDPQVLELAPMTGTPEGTTNGERRMQIISQADLEVTGDYFDPGDRVVVDPGGPHEETRTVQALGSLIFPGGLAGTHFTGEMIVSFGPDHTDRDADGLTGLQEIQRGTDPDSADTDGDGTSDGDEVQAGINPLDPASHFRILSFGIAPTGNTFTIVWSSVPGKRYVVETSANAAPWAASAPINAATGQSQTSAVFPLTGAVQRFLCRVRLVD